MGLVIMDTAVAEQLVALTTNGQPLYNAVVWLYKNQVELAGDLTLADFTPADFPGYEPSEAIEWGEVFMVNGQATIEAKRKVVFAPNDGTDQRIFGWLLISEANTLIAAEQFEKPKRVMASADAIEFFPYYTAMSVI